MGIAIENISKKYNDKYVLTDINIDINRGEVLGIVGNNGAGKTTLMKILCGNIVKFKGNIIYPKFNSKKRSDI